MWICTKRFLIIITVLRKVVFVYVCGLKELSALQIPVISVCILCKHFIFLTFYTWKLFILHFLSALLKLCEMRRWLRVGSWLGTDRVNWLIFWPIVQKLFGKAGFHVNRSRARLLCLKLECCWEDFKLYCGMLTDENEHAVWDKVSIRNKKTAFRKFKPWSWPEE